jgi:hypothetical protein
MKSGSLLEFVVREYRSGLELLDSQEDTLVPFQRADE